HQHVARQPEFTLLWVDLGVDVGLTAVTGAGGLRDGVFHCGDHYSAVDRLLARHRISDLQQLKSVGTHGHGLISSLRMTIAPACALCGEAMLFGAVRSLHL